MLPEGRFDTTLAKVRVDWSFSTRAALNALLQYNSARRAWLTNVRFSLMHRPLSDVFVVYTETRPDDAPVVRSVALKYTHLALVLTGRSPGSPRMAAMRARPFAADRHHCRLLRPTTDTTVRHPRRTRQGETTRCRR